VKLSTASNVEPAYAAALAAIPEPGEGGNRPGIGRRSQPSHLIVHPDCWTEIGELPPGVADLPGVEAHELQPVVVRVLQAEDRGSILRRDTAIESTPLTGTRTHRMARNAHVSFGHMTPLRTITSTAPIRICDNGGWTDTWVARRGKVFNIAVRPLVTVRIDVFPPGAREAPVVLNARNYDLRYAASLDSPEWGPHPLLEASFREIRPPGAADIEITIHSKAPAGASTGTSAAVLVALLGALDRLAGGRRGPREIAIAAHRVETVHLGQQQGIQDQLGSAFGGTNFIEVTEYPSAVVSPLPMSDSIRHELQRRLAVIYLGRPHSSAPIHELVMRTLERQGPDCAHLEALRTAAERARDAFLAGDVDALGLAMRDNTAAQAEMQAELVHRDAWRVIEIAAAHGAAGWKVNGAGGDGGSITLLSSARRSARRAMARAILQDNPSLVPIPIVISRQGLRVWEE
jgi:D-glycero-alpha-D-manno-heptose-7-phosphate kinase